MVFRIGAMFGVQHRHTFEIIVLEDRVRLADVAERMVPKKRAVIGVIQYLVTGSDARSPGESIKYTSSVETRMLDEVHHYVVCDATTICVHG